MIQTLAKLDFMEAKVCSLLFSEMGWSKLVLLMNLSFDCVLII